MERMKHFGKVFAAATVILAAVLIAGCATDGGGKYAYDPLAPANAGTPSPSTSASASSSTTGNMLASTEPMATPAPADDLVGTTLHNGDKLAVSFTDTKDPLLPMECLVQEDGSIMLLFNERFQAAGKTIGALQGEIHDRYVPKYFKYMTVNLNPTERFYFVGGEVRAPNRQVYSGRITVLGAIDTAGGFTEFARKGRVRVIRANGQSYTEDCLKAVKHPEVDKEIFPGDKVQVDKRPL